MKQELFNEYFLDVTRWVKKSRELMIAANYLIEISNGLFNTGNDVINNCSKLQYHPFEAWASVSSAASLLLGLALENLVKSHLIEKKTIDIDENNKVKGLYGGHDLLKMLNDSDYSLNENEQENIKLLTFQLQSLSKYHLAKNPTKQAEFTGRTTNPVTIYNLVMKIAHELLNENNLRLF